MRTNRRLALLCVAAMLLLGACVAVTPEATTNVETGTATSTVTDTMTDTVTETSATPAPEEETAAATDEDSADDAVAAGAGIYKGIFPGASSPGLDTTLYLNADGSLRLISDYLNEEPPVVEVGGWSGNGETVEITLTGQEGEEPYAEPVTRTLALADDQLTADAWIGPWMSFDALAQGMEPPYDAEMAAQQIEENEFLGYYKDFAPAASCCGRDMTLLLGIDSIARLSTDYLNGEAPIVETGTWELNDDGTVTVLLTGRADNVDYEAPVEIVLAAEDGMLNAVSYDESLYGSRGLRFYLFPAIALSMIDMD